MSVEVATRPGPHRHRHTPRVRRLAAEAGLDLTSVTGTGPSGRVTTDDVRRATLAAEVVETAAAEVDAVREPAPAVAPQTSIVEVDVTAALAGGGPLVARWAAATAEALLAVPTVHGAAGRRVDLAVTGHGGSPVVVHDAGGLTQQAIARRLAGEGDVADTATATFTLVDASGRGTLWETAPLPTGQVAALAAGAVVERPAVVRRPDGEAVVAIRSLAHLVLSYDATYVDTADAARFLTFVKSRLERGVDPDRG
jgi:pyruvate dehydrogenase E2 component (dihydrolipoamide acetyltransferase)